MKEVIEGVPLAQFAAVTAALVEAFPLRAVLAIEGLDAATWAKADRGWTEKLDQDPALLSRYEAELVLAQERLHSREEAPPGDDGARAPARAGKARLVRSGTGLASSPVMPSGAAFSAPVPPPAVFAPPAVLAPPAVFAPPPPMPESRHVPRSDDEGTLTAFTVPSELLPFRSAAIQDAPPETPAPLAPEADLPFRSAPTAVPPKAPEGFLPFRETPSPEFQQALKRPAAAPGQGSDGKTVALRGFDALRSLELGGESRSLPWDQARPPLPPPPPPSPGPKPSRSRPPPLPPKARAAPRPVPVPEPPPPPSAPPSVAPPPMSLERHASLCLEMALDPAHSAEALARYQVSPADKARADEFYRARIAADPELRAQWNHAYSVYHAWFTSRPRP